MSKGSGRRPTDAVHAVTCAEAGHAMPDLRGRCFRCGAHWWPASPHVMVPDPEYLAHFRAAHANTLEALAEEFDREFTPVTQTPEEM